MLTPSWPASCDTAATHNASFSSGVSSRATCKACAARSAQSLRVVKQRTTSDATTVHKVAGVFKLRSGAYHPLLCSTNHLGHLQREVDVLQHCETVVEVVERLVVVLARHANLCSELRMIMSVTRSCSTPTTLPCMILWQNDVGNPGRVDHSFSYFLFFSFSIPGAHNEVPQLAHRDMKVTHHLREVPPHGFTRVCMKRM